MKKLDKYVLILILSWWVFISSTAYGQGRNNALDKETPESISEAAHIVMIARTETEVESRGLIQAIRGQLSDLSVIFEVKWVDKLPPELPLQVEIAGETARKTGALTVFWYDNDRCDQVFLYLSDTDQGRLLVRWLDAEQEGNRDETLAIILHSAVEAMLNGGQIGVAIKTDPAEKPSQTEQIQQVSPLSLRPETGTVNIEMGAAYSLGGHSSAHPVIHGLNLGISIVFPVGLSVFASYAVCGPVRMEENETAIDIQSHPISLGLQYAWNPGRFRIGGAFALTGDYVIQDTRAVATETAVADDNEDFVFSVAPLLTAAVAFTGYVGLSLRAGPEFIINNVRYTAIDDSGKTIIDEPWGIRPRITVGLIFIL